MAPRADRGRDRRDQGEVRVRLRRPPAGAPHRADRLRLPGVGVAAQGRRARRARPAPASRPGQRQEPDREQRPGEGTHDRRNRPGRRSRAGPAARTATRADPPGWWVHLRRCAQCGHIGCCDTSPAQHATAHATATGHRFIQSFEPDEDWFYDYETGEVLDGPELAAPTSRPEEQPVPGPPSRVPRRLDGAHPPLSGPPGPTRRFRSTSCILISRDNAERPTPRS